MNFTAFDSRFQITCCSRSGSPTVGIDAALEVAARCATPRVSAAGRIESIAVLQSAIEVERPVIEPQLAADDARDFEEVLDQPGLHLRVALDLLERAIDRRRRHRVGAQQLGPAEDGVERRAQLVRQRGQELVLQPVRLALAHQQLGALLFGAAPLGHLAAQLLVGLRQLRFAAPRFARACG